MFNNVLEWLTAATNGGKDFFVNLFYFIIRFVINTANLFINSVISKFFPFIPDFSILYPILQQCFDFVKPFILFFSDILCVYPFVITFIVFSIIFRVSAKLITFTMNATLNFYSKIKP